MTSHKPASINSLSSSDTTLIESLAADLQALSALQPWAWLLANGYKDVENRGWVTKVRGRFLIHAGKKFGREQREDVAWVRRHFPHIELPVAYELGGIVGQATLVNCVAPGSSFESRWYAGRYGFVVRDGAPLPFVPYRGQLGWFRVPRALVPTIE